jgi:hypothetical protein
MIVDVNVTLSRWPFRRLRGDEPAELVDMLRARGVEEAWTGSFDGLLHRDMAAVNARLWEDCRRCGDGLLVPFGTVNPMLPDWEEDLRRCHEEYRMRGIRLYPGYNGYGLDHPQAARLFRAAWERRLIVQVALRMEDDRTQHPLVRVPPADPAPIPALLRDNPGLRLVLLNALREIRGDAVGRLVTAGVAGFDLSTLEGLGAVEALVRRAGAGALLFGSLFPLFTWEAAALKIQESALDPAATRAILFENARRLISAR